MMTAFRDLPIRSKLLVVITTITFVALIVAAVVQTLYYHHASTDRLVAEQRVLARIIADRSTAALSFADQRVAAENLSALGANTAVEQACIYDADHALFAEYSRSGEAGSGCDHGLPALTEGFAGGRFALSQPILVDDVEIGVLTLRSSLAGLYRQTQIDVVVTLVVLVGALLIATISAMRLQRWVSQPIVRLAETAALITETQDYRLQAKAAGRDEVGQLVETFNSMVRVVRERDDSLRRSEARYRALVEGISAIFYTTEIDDGATALDGSATSLYISPQVEGILGYAPDAWLQRPELFSKRLHDDDRQRVLQMMSACWQSGGDFVCEYRMLHRDGHIVHIRDEGKLLREGDHGRMVMQGLRYDISERRQAEAKVEHLAYHDALTALPNRLLFKSHLAAAIDRAERYGHRFAVHFLDLDRFKDINDSLGHPVGDALLQAVAERLSVVVRRSDTFARFGGDEFAAIQNGIVTSDGASLMAQRFIDALREPFVLGENRVRVGTSVGVVVDSRSNLSVDMLMTQADVAL